MSYHNSSSPNFYSAPTTSQRQAAPPGYHYMPNGTLMLDADMRSSTPITDGTNFAPPGYHFMPDGSLMLDTAMPNTETSIGTKKVISDFILDLSPLTASASTRQFSIVGDSEAVFNLEIKNEDGYYYNFITNTFQVSKAGLYNEQISVTDFRGSIVFPVVTDNDQYDISLSTQPTTTIHANYNEVRFGDGSLDINSSTGSNSLLITKVIYQYVDQTLTIGPYSVDGTIEVGSPVTDTVTLSRGLTADKQAFSIACSVSTAAKCYRIIKQPVSNDVIAFVEPEAGDEPITIPGENIYPTATAAFTGDDINGAITSGAVVRMDNTDLSAVIKVGDKITTPVTTDTVNGARDASGVAVTMDAAVATKMAVGDIVTGNAALNAGRFTVASLDSTNVFSLSSAVAIADGVTLTFSSKINRSLTTVTVVETSGTATDFTMSQAIQFRDNAPLTFFNQMNYQWPISNFAHILKEGMVVVSSTNITADTSIRTYQDTVTEFPGTKNQKIIIKKEVSAISTLAIKPIITRGDISTQKGAVVFDKQQVLALGGTALKIGGYGQNEIFRVSGYDVVFSDLAIALTPITTTTTAASSGGSSASVVVASRNGILDDVSTVSGIGINPKLANPIVDSGAGAVTGAGTIVLDAVQSLESGATLTFPGAGQTATITGYIEVLKAGAANETLRFDVTKLLSIT